MKRDLMVAIVCVLGCLALYLTLGTIESQRAQTFPRVIIILMGVLSLLLLIQTLIIKTVEAKQKGDFPWLRFLTLFGLIVIYFGLMEIIGFYVSAFLFFIAVIVVLGWSKLNLLRLGAGVGVSAAFMATIFVLFSVFLKVQTPRGIFF